MRRSCAIVSSKWCSSSSISLIRPPLDRSLRSGPSSIESAPSSRTVPFGSSRERSSRSRHHRQDVVLGGDGTVLLGYLGVPAHLAVRAVAAGRDRLAGERDGEL